MPTRGLVAQWFRMPTTALRAAMRRLMAQAGLTQADVAPALDVTRQAVGHYLNGTRPITIDIVMAFAEACGTRFVWCLPAPDEESTQVMVPTAAVDVVRAACEVPEDRLDLAASVIRALPQLDQRDLDFLSTILEHAGKRVDPQGDEPDLPAARSKR